LTFRKLCVISGDHPSLPGHFPGSPVVPGVVLLDEIAAALAEWRDGARLASIRAVKFLQPINPEQPFTIALALAEGNEIAFSCKIEGRTAVQGRCQIAR
jgi:3-hydroxyacyl-[acyl-carrier-protein] dehydratase